jgi:ligand-binding sensor domain-containing protein/serine phosphatase RsbU (regulator of sigma subunit)
MRRKISSRLISFFIALLSSSSLYPQAYQFKNYTADNGISQPYVYTVNQDKNGYLWIGTGEGLCRFDGLRFNSYYTKNGLADNFVTASYRDNLRNLWIGHYQGSVTFYNGKKFKAINTGGFSKSPVTVIVGDDKGYVWCGTQNDGLFRISRKFEVELFQGDFDGENIFSLNFTRDNRLLVGTSEGVKVYELSGDKRKPKLAGIIKGLPESKVQCIIRKTNTGSFWVGTEDSGLYLLTPVEGKQDFRVHAIGKNLPVEIFNVQDIYEDAQSNLWLATFGNGVIKLLLSKNNLQYEDFQRFSDDNGLGNRYTKTIYSDHENNIWVGTYGTGLVQLTDNYFSFYPAPPQVSNNIFSISAGPRVKWFGTEFGLAKIDASSPKQWLIYNHTNGFVKDKVTAIFQADEKLLVVGTENHGAYFLDIVKGKFSKIILNEDRLSSSVTSITGKSGIFWIATKNGVYKVEPHKKITTHFSTENGLPHNNINQVFLDHANILWIATHSNLLAGIDTKDAVIYKKIYDGSDLLSVTGIIEDEKNQLWLSTFGNGVFCITENAVEKYTSQQGLKTNYCYSIVQDGSDNIWIGHRLGLSRIRPVKGYIDLFDKVDGITGDCNYNSFYAESNGDVWFGTTAGAIRFDPHKDKKNLVPPIINITSFRLNDKEIDPLADTVLPYDDYRLRVDFIGISFKANTRISYQYKLEGFDVDWSDKTYTNFAQYGKLSDGEYYFLLKAFNNDGVGSQVPYRIHIVISPPFWKRTWFIVLCVFLVIYIFYLIVKTRERSHRRFQAQLQKALNEKTREVIAQKEEIEKKNKDITDSIRYAKRIQDAILPDLEKLRSIFPKSFIFFQPRDIVSGDFYWFEKYDNKLIVACADATGHGVPGAFMSMIGSTLLKDITARPKILSPAHALRALDAEIKTLLKQNDDDHEHTYDSIDIVVCEINTETLLVRICSTKRPVFASIGGKLVLLKKEGGDVQDYETRDLQLSKGDILYLFTDGYPDQFGGSQGKKIKMSNMKMMLEQLNNLPLEEQALAIDRYFNRWKEGHDQVDDVLFIGIQL